MIFRRIKAHVEKENWFAVGIDFCIVVIGVFIGIQVANWNDVRAEQLSEAQYLDRFAQELQLTINHIQAEREFSERSVAAIEAFADALFRDDIDDEALVAATQNFFTDGAFFADFNANRTTFDDLITTGNFDVIKDEALRLELIALHSTYDDALDTINSNIDWIQQSEPEVYNKFDAFRYDQRTAKLFDEMSLTEKASEIRQNRDLLRRHAGFHYWLKDRSIELYDNIEPKADAVLAAIEAERATP